MIACDGEEVELLGTSEGAATGKYQWDDSRTKSGWSDGKKQVSVYIAPAPSCPRPLYIARARVR